MSSVLVEDRFDDSVFLDESWPPRGEVTTDREEFIFDVLRDIAIL